jgi:hypothetical protein
MNPLCASFDGQTTAATDTTNPRRGPSHHRSTIPIASHALDTGNCACKAAAATFKLGSLPLCLHRFLHFLLYKPSNHSSTRLLFVLIIPLPLCSSSPFFCLSFGHPDLSKLFFFSLLHILVLYNSLYQPSEGCTLLFLLLGNYVHRSRSPPSRTGKQALHDSRRFSRRFFEGREHSGISSLYPVFMKVG